MASIRLTPEQKEYLRTMYCKFGDEPFQWQEAKDTISKGLFRIFCDSRFIYKENRVCRKIDGGPHTTYVNVWRMDPLFVKRFI